MKRFLVVTALGIAALAAGAAPAGATNECRGLQICVPVAGPWVVVEAANTVPRPRVEYQLSCPRGYIVGGLDAELSDPAIDLGFLATLGSPVNPGVSTSRAAVFFATYAGASARLSTFRPHIGCIPASGGGQRTPTVARAVPPGRPTSRRVRTMLLSPGPVQRATVSCLAAERLVSASHAVGFYTKTPPTAALASSVSTIQTVRGSRVTVATRSGTAIVRVRAEIQVEAVCAGGR